MVNAFLTACFLLRIVGSTSYVCVNECDLNRNTTFGFNGEFRDVNTFEGYMSPRHFFENYVFHNKMLLHKKSALHIPAYQKWTDDYLRRTASANEKYDDVFDDYSRRAVPSFYLELTNWEDYMRGYNRSRDYFANVVPLWLSHDVVFPDVIQCPFIRKGYYRSVILHSSGYTRAYPHSDFYENVYCQLRGYKTFILVDTKRHEKLLEKQIEGESIRLEYRDLDSRSVNYTEYPELRNLAYYHTHLEPGDCVFVPTGWIHEVLSSHSSNLGVTYWFLPRFNTTLAPKTETFAQLLGSETTRAMEDAAVDFDACYENRSSTLVGIKHTSRFGAMFTDYTLPERITGNLHLATRGTQVDSTTLLAYFMKASVVSEAYFTALEAMEGMFDAIDTNKNGVLEYIELDIQSDDPNNARFRKADIVEFGRRYDSALRKIDCGRNALCGRKIVDIEHYLFDITHAAR